MVDKRTFVVELTGARGVGKSTLSILLARELEARGIDCRRTRPLLEQSPLRGKIRQAFDELRALWLFGGWRPESYGELRKLQSRYRRLRHVLHMAATTGDVYVVDEGAWHLIMTLHIKTANKRMSEIAAVVGRSLPLPDMVVLVQGSDDLVEARRSQRGNPGDRRQPRLNVAGREGLRALAVTLEAFATLTPGFICVSVDADGPGGVSTAVANIADTILDARAGRGR
jgi:thymidylate kinase